MAIVGLVVLHADAHSLYTELLHGAALAVLIVSLLAGAAALGLVAIDGSSPPATWRRWRWRPSSPAGRSPATRVLLPGLTVSQAAAPHDTLVAVVIAVLAGGAILFPSLGLLFGLLLRGRLGEPSGAGADAAGTGAAVTGARAVVGSPRSASLQTRVAVALLIVGVGFLNAADAGWAHVIGVFALFGFMVIGFAAIVPRALAEES